MKTTPINTNLLSLGFNHWFEEQLDLLQASAHEIARIVSVHKDSYRVSKGEGDIFAQLSGNLLYSSEGASELPTVGDWVYGDFFDNDSHAIIYEIIPRKTLLTRKAAGKLFDLQLIAANIDVAFIIQSLNDNFSLQRLERYLAMVNESDIEPIILLSKSDLLSRDQVEVYKQQVTKIAPSCQVLAFNNLDGQDTNHVAEQLKSGLTYCLLGSSGVGKTTLLNRIIGHNEFLTQSVSKLQNKGRHTTTSRQLVCLKNGAMIIDTPGMRELASVSGEEGINETFAEIVSLSQRCKFNDCSHTNEKGCAILAAIKKGELSQQRYQNYLKMKKESEFNQMSFLERKDKDKNLGKLIKATLKNKRR